jgi:uncharacterized membrane protein YhdT
VIPSQSSFDLHQLLGLYLPVSIGVVAQVAFLLLPVDLRNWRDDALNALTYVVMQLLVAAFVFVAIPRWYDVFHLGTPAAFSVLCVVFVIAVVRVLRIIPLEGTDPVLSVLPPPVAVLFTNFYDKDRLLKLALLSESDPDDLRRIVGVKERIRKRGRESLRDGGLQRRL